MKKFIKLIPALALLLVSAVLLSTASYAWFSMNNKVTVTGMEVKTSVSNNLLIAADTIDSTAKKDDSLFLSTLEQTVKGIVAPVSTVDGKTFYYINSNNVKADGDAIADTYISYSTTGTTAAVNSSAYANKFSENSDITKTKVDTFVGAGSTSAASPYIDYVFQLKALNTSDSNVSIKLTTLDLEYTQTGTEVDTCKAYRVAVFVQDITTATPVADAGTLTAIYTVSGATNFTSGKAVNSTSTLGDVTYTSSAVDVATVATGTHYYKVVVRLWLEGEDNTCNNDTFMSLSGEWALNMEMTLSNDATAVTNITKTVGA